MLKKVPQQERSRGAVAAILEAATRILGTRHLRETTTNQIAARAGVGIGSLYQYFTSKEAIVQCLLERHRHHSPLLAGELFRPTPGPAPPRPRDRAMAERAGAVAGAHRDVARGAPRLARARAHAAPELHRGAGS